MHGFLEVEGYTMTRGVRDIPREEGRGTFQSKTYTVTERIPEPPPPRNLFELREGLGVQRRFPSLLVEYFTTRFHGNWHGCRSFLMSLSELTSAQIGTFSSS